jgi:transcriptional regulator GlxA family with amidase domain
VGVTPARFVTAARVETARRLLEESADGLEAICARSGLGTPESMRRAFVRLVGVSPSQYRQRFSRHLPAGERAQNGSVEPRRLS